MLSGPCKGSMAGAGTGLFAAVAGRALYRLYPTRVLCALDRTRADFWYRGSLLLTPDVLVRLVASS